MPSNAPLKLMCAAVDTFVCFVSVITAAYVLTVELEVARAISEDSYEELLAWLNFVNRRCQCTSSRSSHTLWWHDRAGRSELVHIVVSRPYSSLSQVGSASLFDLGMMIRSSQWHYYSIRLGPSTHAVIASSALFPTVPEARSRVLYQSIAGDDNARRAWTGISEPWKGQDLPTFVRHESRECL